jgi:hypothetical protein
VRNNKGRFIKAHAHYWQYEEPNGPTSTAVCVHCSETLVSPNAFPIQNHRLKSAIARGLRVMNPPEKRETPTAGNAV